MIFSVFLLYLYIEKGIERLKDKSNFEPYQVCIKYNFNKMNRTLNFDESNLSITMKMADLKALFYYWQDEWAKKLAEANKVKDKQEWYNSREVAKIFKKSVSTINRWKHSGYLTARTVGGMDYYSKKEIELKLGAA